MKFYKRKIGPIECITSYPDEYKSRIVEVKNLNQLNFLRNRIDKKKQHLSYHYSDYNPFLVTVYNKKYPLEQEYDILSHRHYVYKEGNYPQPSSYLQKLNTRTNELVYEIPGIYNELTTYVNNFLNKQDFYKQEQIFYKCGLLLYGPPGNGKTSYVRNFVQNNLPKDALVIWFKQVPDLTTIDALRDYKGLKIFIFEELVSILAGYKSDISEFLEFMDGEKSIDNAIYIATTNYPEELPGNIVERPGRFDKIIKFNNPDKDVRKFLFDNHYKLNYTDQILEDTANLSIAQIKELYLQVKIHDKTIEDALKYIKNHQEFVKNNFAEIRKLGI